ncbi:chloride channel protein [Actinomycetospora cinnamomea]|uniref:H+/Cl-antiporter ClcA n=1 Tax=Actinomycetospora cinnamomea TaxID=663609 RepID=A0A2U1EE18_9PSEU|nr:chloride channel protein [Actinomycetospora cinnamomea]PVY97949.1 H+/Cl- antiporter ClcA [Actinomycetospora cinnamomea]
MTRSPLGAGTGDAAAAAAPGVAPPPAPPTPAELLRSPAYLRLLVLAALLGVPISALSYGFLQAVAFLQDALFTRLPVALGLGPSPVWWPLPILAVGGLLVGCTIRYLPGQGGHSPADGFSTHAPPTARELPGVIVAAASTLVFGAVLGPEAPLIAIGGGLAVLAVRAARTSPTPTAVTVVASTGSFAAISTLLGSPLLGAFLLMEAAGIGGATLGLVLLPGLLAAGIGSLIFVGLDSLTGLGPVSLVLPDLPAFVRPDVAQFAWAVVIGLAAAVLGTTISWTALRLRSVVDRAPVLLTTAAGLVVAVLAALYALGTGNPTSDVLFSGQESLPALLAGPTAYSLGALVLLVACKALGYAVSLSAFRGGPIFPAMFLGAAGGLALAPLPGLSVVPAVAMGIGAMSVVMLRLPLTSVLLAVLLLSTDGLAVTPLVIVAVVVAHLAAARLRPGAPSAGDVGAEGGTAPDEAGSPRP